jgi:hypothetical protein
VKPGATVRWWQVPFLAVWGLVKLIAETISGKPSDNRDGGSS